MTSIVQHLFRALQQPEPEGSCEDWNYFLGSISFQRGKEPHSNFAQKNFINFHDPSITNKIAMFIQYMVLHMFKKIPLVWLFEYYAPFMKTRTEKRVELYSIKKKKKKGKENWLHSQNYRVCNFKSFYRIRAEIKINEIESNSRYAFHRNFKEHPHHSPKWGVVIKRWITSKTTKLLLP